MSTSKPTDLVERVLKLSRADDCIVILEESTSVNVRFANNSTTTNGAVRAQELIIIAIREKRVGMVHRSYVDSEALEELVREAEAACDFQEAAEDYCELESGSGNPDGWDGPTVSTDINVFAVMTRDLASAFKRAEGDNQKLFGFAEHTSSNLWLATSRGERRRHNQLKGQIEMTMKSSDFTDSAWAGQATRDFSDVDTAALIAGLRTQLGWSKTKLELAPGKYETLLSPSAVADLMVYAYWTAAGRDAAEGRTVYSAPGGATKVGEKLADDQLTLYSDPAEAHLSVSDFEIVGGTSSHASVFDNGIHLERTNWIENGVLRHLITPRYWAKKSGVEATPYIDNLVMMTPGTKSMEQMVKTVKRGLLVTCLWYIREVDPQRLLLTGLTRDGVFLIEDGKVKGAVNNFRWNMSPVEMLSMIQDSGATGPTLAREFGDYFTFAKMPPLLVRDFNMSSVSQAT
ncbi:MAG TPA: metallopeptidase TldD-related protein [Candidatus Saccharimonadia bacterium]|nr:metallopeptidase TldD-related protein [Candidatus Saccharimonadia bacterium]